MKRFSIIGISLVILILLVALSWHHFRHSGGVDYRTMSDAGVRKLFTGNWAHQDSSWGGLGLHSKGNFSNRLRSDSPSGTKEWLYEGTWGVKDEFLTLTITNAIARNTTDSEPIGSVDRFTIIKMDGSHLALETDGVKTYL